MRFYSNKAKFTNSYLNYGIESGLETISYVISRWTFNFSIFFKLSKEKILKSVRKNKNKSF